MVVVWKEERSVRKPRVEARPSWRKIKPHPPGCPRVGLDPGYRRLPCGGRRRGEWEDLAVCRVHVIWRSDDILSCGNENVGQGGPGNRSGERCLRVRVGEGCEEELGGILKHD